MRIQSHKVMRNGGWHHKTGEPVTGVIPERPVREKPALDARRRAAEMFCASGAREARIELALGLSVSVEALERLWVGVGYDWNGVRFWSIPERRAIAGQIEFEVTGVCRRYEDGSKKHMPGSKAGLYFTDEWFAAPGPIFLPEGASDTAALITMGLCAIGRPSNVGGIGQLIRLGDAQAKRPIVVLGENDRKPPGKGCPRNCGRCRMCWPGRSGANETAVRLRDELRREVVVRMVFEEKDTRSWMLANGPDALAFLCSIGAPNRWRQDVRDVEPLPIASP